MSLNGKMALYCIISPNQRDLDDTLIVSTTQSRDIMCNYGAALKIT